MKRGKVGTSGYQIAASLYGTRGRPLNPVEQRRDADNAHLAAVSVEQRHREFMREIKQLRQIHFRVKTRKS